MYFRFSWIGWIIVILVVLSVLGWIKQSLFPGAAQQVDIPQQTAPFGQTASLNPPTTGSTAANPSQSSATAQRQADLADSQVAAIRAELRESSRLLAEASSDSADALSQIAIWEKDVEPLQDNSQGRIIAANDELAVKFAYLFQEKRPTKQALKSGIDRINSLHDETDRLSAATPPGKLSPDDLHEIRELHQRSRQAKEAWTNAVVGALAISQQATREAASPTTPPPTTPPSSGGPVSASQPIASTNQVVGPSDKGPAPTPPTNAANTPAPTQSSQPKVEPSPSSATTAEVATTTSDPKTGPESKNVDSLKEKLKEINDKAKLDELNAQIAAEERRKLVEKEKDEKRRAENERVAEAKSKLVAEARSDEVQRILQPFLVRRTLQPRMAGASVQFRRTVNEEPMSLSALEGCGALDESVNGLSRLARIGSHRELSNPRWDYNPSSRTWSGDTQARLKQAQELLRRLGPTMVDEGLLSP